MQEHGSGVGACVIRALLTVTSLKDVARWLNAQYSELTKNPYMTRFRSQEGHTLGRDLTADSWNRDGAARVCRLPFYQDKGIL